MSNLDLQATVGQIRTTLRSVLDTLADGYDLPASYALLGAVCDYTVLFDAQDDDDYGPRINSLDNLAHTLAAITTLDSDLRGQLGFSARRGTWWVDSTLPTAINRNRHSLRVCVQGAINSLDIIR